MNSHEIIEKLQNIGVDMDDVPKPGGSYVSVNVRGNIAYIAIQFPKKYNEFLYLGKLGKDLTSQEGFQAAELAGINVLKQVNKHIGFEKILGLNHADIYYQADGDWDEGPFVANGASELFTNVLGERGIHTRAIFGVERLPKNFSVGVTCTFTMIEGLSD